MTLQEARRRGHRLMLLLRLRLVLDLLLQRRRWRVLWVEERLRFCQIGRCRVVELCVLFFERQIAHFLFKIILDGELRNRLRRLVLSCVVPGRWLRVQIRHRCHGLCLLHASGLSLHLLLPFFFKGVLLLLFCLLV